MRAIRNDGAKADQVLAGRTDRGHLEAVTQLLFEEIDCLANAAAPACSCFQE